MKIVLRIATHLGPGLHPEFLWPSMYQIAQIGVLSIQFHPNLIVNIVQLVISVMSNWRVTSNEVKSCTIVGS